MNNSKIYKPTDKMRDLIKDNSALILVMGRFGISLGFGDKSVREACRLHNVDENTFLQVANFCSGNEFRYEDVSLPSLINYLKQAHEYFLDFNLPNIRRKLIEAIDCSGGNDIAMLIVRFYDEYAQEISRHVEHENNTVFVYVERLLNGFLDKTYTISKFEGKHAPIGYKLKELKEIIIQYYPKKNSYLLNEVLLNIMLCEEDLSQHCKIEDELFIPAVKLAEYQLKQSDKVIYVNNNSFGQQEKEHLEHLSDREKEILILIAKGCSNKDIANQLFLSVHTVTTHRKNISSKLQIHTTAGLIIYAIANKLVNIKDIQK